MVLPAVKLDDDAINEEVDYPDARDPYLRARRNSQFMKPQSCERFEAALNIQTCKINQSPVSVRDARSNPGPVCTGDELLL